MEIMLAVSAENVINSILNAAIWGAPPVIFIVFLILFIVQIVKVKKEGAGKAKAIVFGCISGYFLLTTIAEVAFVWMLASAISHM